MHGSPGNNACVLSGIIMGVACVCVHTNLKLRLENKLFGFSETHSNQRNLMLNTSVCVDQNNSRTK